MEDFNRLVIDGAVLASPEVMAAAKTSMAEMAGREGTYVCSRQGFFTGMSAILFHMI